MDRIAQVKVPVGEEQKRVTLDKVKFNLIPEDLPQPKTKETEELDYQTASDIFRQTYKLVYHAWPEVSLGKNWETAVNNARAAGMAFKTFATFVIAGYKLTHPLTPFFVSNLTAPSSAGKIAGLRKVCLDKFNVEDAESLGMVLDIVLDNIDEYMLASEVGFGSWITGAKLRLGGNSTPRFYDNKELGLYRYWLAVEPTYHSYILKPFLREKFGTDEEKKHRHLVLQDIGLLKRRQTLASTVFNSRTRIMPTALKRVLQRHALTPDCFTYPDEVVYESYPFWNGLGLAIQHYEALKAVRGERHRLWP
jgi:hypothetical protein